MIHKKEDQNNMFKQIAKAFLGAATGTTPEGFVVDTIANLAFSGKTPKSSKKLPTRASTPPIPGQVRTVPNTMETRVRGAGTPADDRPSNISIRNLQSVHLATMAQFGKTPNIGLGAAQTQLRLK